MDDIEMNPDMMPTVTGIQYAKRRDGRHVVQLHTADDSDITYEFEVADERVAVGLKEIGRKILDSIDGSGENGVTSSA